MLYCYARWSQLLGLLLISITLAACGADKATPNAPPPLAGGGSTLNVVAKEFAFTFSPAQAHAGPITFAVANDGAAVHDFRIEGNGVDERTTRLEAGQRDSFTVDLQPGTYRYVCTVGGHDQLGMQGTLTVVE
jgi:plastocyanin